MDPKPPLIGRAKELVAINASISRVEDGFGQAILITGPAGIGKTQLMDAVVRISGERSFQLLRGSARPVDTRLAYAPILQAIGQAVRRTENPKRAKMLRGLESLGLVLEGLDLPPPPPLGDAKLERTRLFESMVRLIDRMSTESPLLLVIEDMHWVDPASIDMIAFTAKELASIQILLALSFDSEVQSTAVVELLHELRVSPTTTELRLTPLETSHVGKLAESVLGAPMRESDVEDLAKATGGNPFLTIAYLEDMRQMATLKPIESRWVMVATPEEAMPIVAVEFYQARVDGLGSLERELIEILAVGGGTASHHDLLSLAGLDDNSMADAMGNLLSTGLLVEEDRVDAVLYRCSHSLITQVVYSQIPVFRRRHIHAAFIRVYDTMGRAPKDLVWHYLNVGDEVDQSVRLTVLADAGRRALAQYASTEAADLLNAALEVARSIDSSEDVPDILDDLGRALHQNGEERAAVEVWRAAGDLVTEPSVRASLLRQMADAESNLGHFAVAEGMIAEGVDGLSEQVSPELFELRGLSTLNSFRVGDIAAATTGTRLFSELVAKHPSPRNSMHAAMLTTGSSLELGSYEEAKSHADEAYEAAVALEDPVAQQQALAFLALIDVSLGDFESLKHHLQIGHELTDEIGLLLRAYRVLLYQFVGDVYAGHWEHARDVAVEAGLLAEQFIESRNQVVLHAMPALLEVLEGDFEGARVRLDRSRNDVSESGNVEPALLAMIDILDAWCDLESGDVDSALATLEARNGQFLQGLLPPWGLMLLGESLARSGSHKWTGVVEALRAMGPQTSLPAVWTLRISALAVEDPHSAAGLWAQAALGFEALGMPFEAARATLECAELLTSEDAQRGTELFETHRLFTDLGARRYRDRAAQVLRAMGSILGPEVRVDAQRLSRRQSEVAALVAEGLTNAQIAERLYISQRTVTTHLENIYRQLAINSRTALTRYVLKRESEPPGPT